MQPTRLETVSALEATSVVAVVRVTSGQNLTQLASALASGGVRLVEITLTVPGALDAINRASRELEGEVIRLHEGRCQRVGVSVTFNGVTKLREFPPVTRVSHVHQWATHNAFDMSPRDAAEHVLELVGGDERPDADTQIGTLTSGTLCAVAFDLVPFKRVEG